MFNTDASIPTAPIEHFDVLIVGAGLSGIGAAYHLQSRLPSKRFAILETRAQIGGTWDLFRYPGIRSDSDMYTLGYSFRPWTDRKSIADGPAILRYIHETAEAYDLHRHIRFQHRVKSILWSTRSATWTVDVEVGHERKSMRFVCRFLYMCTGYYSYDAGHDPPFPGRETFAGDIIHPQFWPEKLDYTGKKVVVIGSGATAITLVPAMAEQAGHVTMLQRSPTYIAAVPEQDKFAHTLQKLLPDALSYAIVRLKNLLTNAFYYSYARTYPAAFKRALLDLARKQLPPEFDTARHLTPRYDPWDQRLCAAPDGDFFDVIRRGKASIVTDEIERFTPRGIRLKCGEELPADMIITATGLKMELMSGISVFVDGAPVTWGRTLTYKGFMYAGVPNLASSFGYTMASWTLKADMIGAYVCRLLRYMDRKHVQIAVPHDPSVKPDGRALNHLSSGYVQRARDQMPKQGRHMPWQSSEDYFRDVFTMPLSRVDDGAMVFARAGDDWKR